MKKVILLSLCLILLLCGCQKKNEPEKVELGGIYSEGGLLYLDPENPLIDGKTEKIDVTLSDGTKGTSTMKIPLLNVDLPAAAEVSEYIAADLDERFGEYFKKPDDRIIKIDYTCDIDLDMLAVLVSVETKTPTETSSQTLAYYYDILCDTDLNMLQYVGQCGVDFNGLMEGLLKTDWANEYLLETGFEPEDSCISAVVFNEGDENKTFNVYCINPDGLSETVVLVEPVIYEFPFPVYDEN